ncbi:MAG: type II secretion system F family protein [archaeon]
MVLIINLPYIIVRRYPHLKTNIIKAHIRETPEQFVRKSFFAALYMAIGLTVLLFFFFDKMGHPLILLPLISVLIFAVMFILWMNSPKGIIRKREREINKEVLFAGRYLLVKLEGGTPLFNSLIDASKSYGISGKYFKEIVEDINLGVPIEDALERAREFNCSEMFKMILSELLTTLKTGADVVPSLKEVINQITSNQIIEIKEYSKKLNAFMMLYLIIAVVIPSLGMTMFTVIAGFLSIQFTGVLIFLSVFSLVLIQMFFIMLFKAIRPMVNL